MEPEELFRARLNDLRKLHKLTQEQVSDIIGINKVSEPNRDFPNKKSTVDEIIAAADYFDVSTDYLIGRTNTPTKMMESSTNSSNVIKLGHIKQVKAVSDIEQVNNMLNIGWILLEISKNDYGQSGKVNEVVNFFLGSMNKTT